MLYEKTNKLNLNENFFRQIMVEYDDGGGGEKLNLFLHFFVVVVEHICYVYIKNRKFNQRGL